MRFSTAVRTPVSAVLLGLALLIMPCPAMADSPAGAPTASPAPGPSPAPPVAPGSRKPIWEYRKELGLTEKQVADIKVAAADLEKAYDDTNLQLNGVNGLNRKFQSEVEQNASIDDISKTLHEIADVQIQYRLTEIRSSRKVAEILTPEQRAMWVKILHSDTQPGAPASPHP